MSLRGRHHRVPAAVGVAAVLGCAAALAQQGRDRTVDPTGTAVIAGAVVTDTEPPVPLRRAVVTVTGGGLSSSRSAITDDDGRFAIGGLPGGRYAISAAKAAYLESAYGARRPGRPGTPLSLADGQRADIVIRMPRGAVVEGVVRDEDGQPLAGVDIYAVNPKSPGSIGLSLTPRTDKVTTDDRGVYRIYGLAPGEYVIAATFEVLGSGDIGRRRDAEVDALLDAARRRGSVVGAPPSPPPPAQTVGYPLTYYPGVPVFASALRVRLAAGDERVGLDFPLVPVSVATVEGSVVRADGQPPTTVRLSLNVDGPPTFSTGSRPILSTPPGPDGRFKYSSMAPGHYALYARAGGPAARGVPAGGRSGLPVAPPPGGPTEVPLFAIAEFDVTGQDISGLTLVLEPGATLSGRVEFDGTSPPPEDVTGLRVRAAVPGRTGYSSSSGGTTMGTAIVAVPPATVDAGGAFEVRGLAPGQYRLSATVPPDISERWWLRSATFEGRDLLDDTVDVRGSDITGVVVRFTDRRSELAGTLQSAAGLPAPDYFVVVFPSDRALWRAGSRRIASTRPDTTGAFSIRDLPGGAYLLAALTDLEPADLEDPAFLEEMAAQSVPVTIGDGQRTVQDIRIAR